MKLIRIKNKYLLLGILLIIFMFYLILIQFNNNHIKEGIDSRYLEQEDFCKIDSDCVRLSNNCAAVNKYNFKEDFLIGCEWEKPYVECQENKCILANYINTKYKERKLN